MSNVYILMLASLLCYVQCLPLESSSKSVSKDSLHLYVNNSTKSTNYHLASVMDELEDVDDEIARELDSILPYLNVLIDALLGTSYDEDDDGCVNDLIIQLIADKDPKTQGNEQAAKPAVKADE